MRSTLAFLFRFLPAAAVLAGLVPTGAQAQIRIEVLRGNLWETAGDSVDYGALPAGDAKLLTFQIKNQGGAPFTLQTLRLTGAGANSVFRLDGEPALPRIVPPGLAVGFGVRFAPPSAGQWEVTLDAGSAKTSLKGAATRSLNLYAVGESSPLASGSSVAFGSVKSGQTAVRKFRLSNEAAVALSTGLFLVTGESFRLSSPGPPAVLPAGEQALFDVTFAPKKPGLHQGAIEFADRRVLLDGFALQPEMPRPTVAVEKLAAASSEQGKVSVKLESPAEFDGSGTLAIQLEPLLSGMPPDPAVVFLDSGKSSLPFTVHKGDSMARFSSGTTAVFQTGTTAGKITLTATLAAHSHQTAIDVAPAPPRLTAARTSAQTGQITVDVTGFDNARTLRRVSFQFRSRNGADLGSPLQADVTQLFRQYFLTSQVGGSFLMQAWFPVQGDVTQIGTVEIEMENSAGATQSQRVSF